MQNTTDTETDQVAGFVLVEIADLQTSSESDTASESSTSELSSSFLDISDDGNDGSESINSDSVSSGNFQSFDWRSNNTPSAVCRMNMPPPHPTMFIYYFSFSVSMLDFGAMKYDFVP